LKDLKILRLATQWSDSGNDSEGNIGIEYENVFQNDYEIDFGKDSVKASVSEFDIDTEIKSDIGCYIYCESRYLTDLVTNPVTNLETHSGNATLPLDHFPLTAFRVKKLYENSA
jgi:hypothetical protein